MTATKDSLQAELVQVAAVAVCWLEALGYTQQAAFTDIRHERFAQDTKFGSQRHHANSLWLTILTEEVGETARAILEGEEA